MFSSLQHQDVVQLSFDTFMALDRNGDRLIDIGELRELLRQYSSVVAISDSDAQTIMDMCSQPDSQMLQFSEFHNIFCAVQICAQLQQEDMLHLRMRDVKERLVAAGINPTQSQVESMFLLGDAYQTYGQKEEASEDTKSRNLDGSASAPRFSLRPSD